MREAPRPASGEVLVAVEAAGVNRPDVMQRGGSTRRRPAHRDISRARNRRHRRRAWRGRRGAGDRLPRMRTGHRRGVCRVLRRARTAQPPRPRWIRRRRGRGPARDLLHGLDQRLRPRPPRRRRVDPGARGIERHRHHRDPARQSVRATVYVTAGSRAKCDACLALGADAAIRYRDEDFVERIGALTGGRGVDVVLDMVAGDYVRGT